MNYFIMVGEGLYPIHPIAKQPRLAGGPWYRGTKLQITFDTPIECELEEIDNQKRNIKMLYGNKSIPIIHNSLVEALVAVGVNNLELFPTVLRNPTTGEEHTEFKAFNIIGLVSAVDLNTSKLMHGSVRIQGLDTDFEKLNLDVTISTDLHLFRLEESSNAICVSEKVKAEIEKRNIPGIVFYASGEWSG